MLVKISENFYYLIKHDKKLQDAIVENQILSEHDSFCLNKYQMENRLSSDRIFNSLKDLAKNFDLRYFISFNDKFETNEPGGEWFLETDRNGEIQVVNGKGTTTFPDIVMII